MSVPRYLTRLQASEYLLEMWNLKRSVSYLNQMAAKGTGPHFHKAGRTPLYARSDLNDWAREVIGPAVLSNMEADLEKWRQLQWRKF